MAITRRTARFNELATRTEALLAEQGIVLEPSVIDRLLNAREEEVAQLLGVAPRTALGFAPDDLPQTIAVEVSAAIAAQAEGAPTQVPPAT
ncbi:hypothetical protein ICW40_07490 [Actinotalea ferrariae]|uniref:hypothetical protein n=1 Tax=Actinotalea ferrariae TaxID=1386098 RepID=UPI001C8B7836|nr:hypothetical protein [Actinotalea ferrariae]MBX9244652.1 hypothetical protein [Actinotalea ferrariae]